MTRAGIAEERRVDDALAVIDGLLDLLEHVAEVAWWPAGGDPARPRVSASTGPGRPEAGDPVLAVAYRRCTQHLAMAHLAVARHGPAAWRPHHVLADGFGRWLDPELVRHADAAELRFAVYLLAAKLVAAVGAGDSGSAAEAAAEVLDAWECFPADVRRPPAGYVLRECSDPGCPRTDLRARGFCHAHYEKARKAFVKAI